MIRVLLSTGNSTDEHHSISEIIDGAGQPLVFAWCFAGILCFLSLISFFWQLHRHLTAVEPYKLYPSKSVMELLSRSSQTPEGWVEAAENDRTAFAYKRHAIAMIFMIPVFSITSYLSMWLLRIAVVLEFIRAIYEAIILYVFLLVMANMLGGMKRASFVLINIPKGNYLAVPPLACCCRPCCPHIKITPRWFRVVRWLVFQYCIVKPGTILIAVGFYFANDYKTGDSNAYTVLRVIGVVSVLLSAYGLFIMYKATHEILSEYKTGLKFATIKAIVLLAAIQGSLIQLLLKADKLPEKDYLSSEEQGEIWNNFLLVVEMFLISFLFARAFPSDDYTRGIIGIPEEKVDEAVRQHPHPDKETLDVITMTKDDEL